MEYYSAIKVSQYWFTLEHESHGWMNLKNCAKSKKSDQKKKKEYIVLASIYIKL